MKLAEHISNETGLADLLNYAHLIDDGILINKDGAFLMGFRFRGPDINSATTAELDSLTESFNQMATLLGDGWMLHIDEIRIPSVNYSEKGYFPDPVSAMIDEERRQLYAAEGTHFENIQFITFVWKFPLPLVKTANYWFVEGIDKNSDAQNLTKLLEFFQDEVNRCISLLKIHLVLSKLNSEDLLSFLNTCITGDLLPVAVPLDGGYIDTVLSRANIVGGYYPKINNKHLHVLTFLHYRHHETIPGWLEDICTYPLVYRFSNRYIPLSEATAAKEIKRYQKDWHNKVKGLLGVVREVVFTRPTTKVNQDALMMKEQAGIALTENSSQGARFGYWTSTLVLLHEDQEVLQQAIKAISSYAESKGFSILEEKVNAMDAWLGSIPGHGSANMRRMFVSSKNLGHLLPLHSIWAGDIVSSQASLLPKNSPPVFYAATTGKTPFRFHIDVSDVGHQVVLGPTGSGKTTYLQLLIAQFLRYEYAQVYIFDKDYSHHGLTAALGGYYYDIGNVDNLSFCPFADLSTESKKTRATQFIENLVTLQNVLITPEMRASIYQAIKALSSEAHRHSRNITVLKSMIQHQGVRDALQYYSIEGQMPMLDATEDTLKTGYLQSFEMGWLLAQKPEIYLPVLMTIFDHIESRLEESNSKHPTLIILEEAWLYISHPFFAAKLRDWLKTLRKKNARAVFATQSLSDLYDPAAKTLSTITAAMLEACPTKIYLPNKMIDEEIFTLYKKMGLNERQVEIIKSIAMAKRHYYVVTPHGNRLIDLGLSDGKPMTMNFIGLSQAKSKALVECQKTYADKWLHQWLVTNSCNAWAAYLSKTDSLELVA